MSKLKRLIVEIHRRSLWQVLTVYLGASWVVLEVSDQVIDRYLLPEWTYGAAFVLLAIGLPIVLATAVVREEGGSQPAAPAEPRDPTLLGETTIGVGESARGPALPVVGRLLTWPKAILGGMLAFTGLGLVSAFIVLQGTARLTAAEGTADEAFSERAWIIVSDFAAPEAEDELALAAKTALTLDLQQSKYVNVRGRNLIAPVLRRMGLPDTLALDERLALEVAEREGIAAVLAPSISRLEDDYVLGARVVEAGTGRDLIVVSAAAGAGKLLEGVQALSREIRRRLGEAGSEIEESRPLPEVTTRSLEALKVYARAAEANEARDFPRALELASEAIRLDSTFAMAYRMASVAAGNMGRITEAGSYAVKAYELRHRLTDRERLFVEARYQSMVQLDPRQTVAVYERLLADYPDDSWALNNLAVMAGVWLGDRERAYEAYLKAVTLDPYSTLAYSNVIEAARRTDRMSVADSLIDLAVERGFADAAVRWRRDQAIALAQWETAEALCDSLLSLSSSPAQIADDRGECGALDVARGRIGRAVERLEGAIEHRAAAGQYVGVAFITTELALAEQIRGRSEAAASRVEWMLERVPADSLGEIDRMISRTQLRSIAGELGRPDLDERIQAAYAPPDIPLWVASFSERVGEGAGALGRGEIERALASFADARGFDARPPGGEELLDLLSGLAFAEAGATDSAMVHLEAVVHPGVVASWPDIRAHLPIVLRRLAELEEGRGNTQAAIGYYRRLIELWSDADPELQPQVESARRAIARLAGERAGA